MIVGLTANYQVLVALLLASTTLVHAHHSITAVYDFTQPVTLEGVITAFRFVNPHPSVEIRISTNERSSESWRLEMDNLHELVAIGMKADSFKIGDSVLAIGSKARDGSRGLYVRSLKRTTDGYLYEQVGPSPRVSSGSR